MEKIFGRDHVIALFQKLQMPPQRICLDQVAIQSRVPDYVAGWEHAVVSHDRWTSASRVAEVPAPGQGGKDEVLQSRTDESQGYLPKDSAELYPTVPRLVLYKSRRNHRAFAVHVNNLNRRRRVGNSRETRGPKHPRDRESQWVPCTDTSTRSTLAHACFQSFTSSESTTKSSSRASQPDLPMMK